MRHIPHTALRPEPVSHDRDVMKEVWLRKGDVPNLFQFARASLPPERFLSGHAHADASEVYLVTRGLLRVRVNGTLHEVAPGGCFVVDPGDYHETGAGPEGADITYFLLPA